MKPNKTKDAIIFFGLAFLFYFLLRDDIFPAIMVVFRFIFWIFMIFFSILGVSVFFTESPKNNDSDGR